jgi:hypothetical protein
MNYSDWTPPAAENLDILKTQRQLKPLQNPFLDGKRYFLDMGDKQIYGWNEKFLELTRMELVVKLNESIKWNKDLI